MRVAGRQKGSKVKSYTHILVNPTAPKTRYVFSMHSTEAGAQKAAKKYSPLVGHELKVVKQLLTLFITSNNLYWCLFYPYYLSRD